MQKSISCIKTYDWKIFYTKNKVANNLEPNSTVEFVVSSEKISENL